LIGRWGDVNRSFDELSTMAKEKYTERKTSDSKKQIQYYQRQLDNIELDLDQFEL